MIKKSLILSVFVLFVVFLCAYFLVPKRIVVPASVAIVESDESAPLDPQLTAGLDRYIEYQWAKNRESWLPKDSVVGTECIVFYVHGYLPIKCRPRHSAYFFKPLESALQGINYSLCNPGLDLRRKYASFAQGFDVYQVSRHLEQLLKEQAAKFPDVPIVCIGHSNGASTLLSALCKKPSLQARIAGVVLLAPYADILEASPLKIPKFFGGAPMAQKALKFFVAPHYDQTLSSPVELVEQGLYSDKLPTLLAHPTHDGVVPYNNFELLQRAFQLRNKNIHFLSLEKDAHALRHPSQKLKDELSRFVSGILKK